MTIQSESQLENELLAQLEAQGYERVYLEDEAALVANFRQQLELHNKIKLTDNEFKQILNHISKGNVFDKAKNLREKFNLRLDNGESKNIEFLQINKWCQNNFQVANQITNNGKYENRYDVTILINGLPLVQIELKRAGVELKEAFNQVNRYRRHSYSANYGLFDFIQIFVISNGVNTKYYSNTVGYENNKKDSYKFTNFWADKDNKHISRLEDFAKTFLEKCHLAKMICKYTVLATNKTLLVLRPYQYYAVEAILDKVEHSQKGGYIWHTTGSGKTLTSFKASQVLISNPNIYKVVFVVDRKDLDNQTVREFNNFREGSVDTTTNTRNLIKQFNNPDNKLIVTTIQKLNTAISKERHQLKMDQHKDKKIVFIFDECHRSQFGETHQRITNYFNNYQMFGFTGTPIFKDNAASNALGKRTTADLFGERLHTYTIVDAIHDQNVLKFSVEYFSGLKYRGQLKDEDEMVAEGINVKEIYQSDDWIEQNVDYIIKNHARKTSHGDFTAILATAGIDELTRYYDIFKAKKEAGEHKLKIATIFTYQANEKDKDADGMLDQDIDLDSAKMNQHSRDKLESYIADYNEMFGSNYTTRDSNSFYDYYRNIADRVKAREIDILIVVNMFLTGFDSKTLNTLYVDKNLKYHGLIQAYSRTNRILNQLKSHGNIVAFRNLKKNTDQALRLFANKDAEETVFVKPYRDYVEIFNKQVVVLRQIAVNPDSVDQLLDEKDQEEFVKSFRQLLKTKNILNSFAEFVDDDLEILDQEFEEYKSKYLDIYDSIKTEQQADKISILNDLDFELELIKRDEINVGYILRLISQMVGANNTKQQEIENTINNFMNSEPKLRSKRELIERFLKENLPSIEQSSDVENEFYQFWDQQKQAEFNKLCSDCGFNKNKLEKIISSYLIRGEFSGLEEGKITGIKDFQLIDSLKKKPKILERQNTLNKIKAYLTKFISTFIDGM